MRKILAALRFAISGICFVFRNETNFRIEVCCGIVALALAFLLKLSNAETALIAINTGIVLSAEMFNTAIERICNRVCPGPDPAIKSIKDISAGAVLVSVLAAFVCGLVIFIPHIVHLIKTV